MFGVTPMPWSTRPSTIVAGCPVGYCKSFCGKTTPRNILVHVCLPDPCLSPVLDWLSSVGCVSKTLPCGLLRGFVPTTSKITKMLVQLTELQSKQTLSKYDVGTKFFVSGHSSIFQRSFSHWDGMVLYVSPNASTA